MNLSRGQVLVKGSQRKTVLDVLVCVSKNGGTKNLQFAGDFSRKTPVDLGGFPLVRGLKSYPVGVMGS